ncbi:phosphotransferase [Deltaproteobacteria bacterium]|nr:phosphotransferase [Deltaproteobacteria bacterium]
MSINSPINEFINSFLKDKGLPFKEAKHFTLAGDGSKRHFIRISPLSSGPDFVVMENYPANEYLKKENLAYLMIGKHLFKKGLPVPEIYRFDLTNGWFIMEDMGDKNLQDKILKNRNRIVIYEKVLDILFRLQIEGLQSFDTGWCCQTKSYNQLVMRRYETDYFRDSFLSNYLKIKNDWPELEAPFDYLSSTASDADNQHLMHRDFQSRNIMPNNDQPGILDWQGARLGPLSYDLASLLIDPYVDLAYDDKNHIYMQYLSLLKSYRSAWIDPFERYFPYIAILRNLQILGAFSFLAKVQGKTYFEDYITPALKSLHLLLDELADPKLSSLRDLVHSLVMDERTKNRPKK